jgi:hypothetical protein
LIEEAEIKKGKDVPSDLSRLSGIAVCACEIYSCYILINSPNIALALIVPDSHSGSSTRITTRLSDSFTTAMAKIHDAMGSMGMKIQLENGYLTYTVKGLAQGVALKLSSIEEWSALQDHIKTLIKKKDEVISVNFIVEKKELGKKL